MLRGTFGSADAALVKGSEGIEKIHYSLALRDGVVLRFEQNEYVPAKDLAAPEGTRVVDFSAGRCGCPSIIVEPLESPGVDDEKQDEA